MDLTYIEESIENLLKHDGNMYHIQGDILDKYCSYASLVAHVPERTQALVPELALAQG